MNLVHRYENKMTDDKTMKEIKKTKNENEAVVTSKISKKKKTSKTIENQLNDE